MLNVNYLIIGAGVAGLTMKRVLEDQKTVIIDRNPGGYKIGESIIPEHFYHPLQRALLPKVRQLPSYTPKMGTVFIEQNTVASFPLPENEIPNALHIAREELEALMIQEWNIPVIKETVKDVDLDEKIVITDKETYKVAKQILDCSGPAMVVARKVGGIKEIWPVHARWGYFDVVESNDQRFWDAVKETGKEYLRIDAPHNRLLSSTEFPSWSPSRATLLTMIKEGLWMWNIPLHDSRILSLGLVSRSGDVSDDDVFHAAEHLKAANYTLRRRSQDHSSSWNRMYARSGFAKHASVPGTMNYILISDAFGFADPVYSVGTGLAVNLAREVAEMLNDGGWTEEKLDLFTRNYTSALNRAIEGFEFWYNHKVLADDKAASTVQREFLVGNAFHTGFTKHYGTAIADAAQSVATTELDARLGRTIFDEAEAAELTGKVLEIIGVQNREIAGWGVRGIIATPTGLNIRLLKKDRPELAVLVDFHSFPKFYFAREAGFTISYLNVFDSPYPMDDDARATLTALIGYIKPHVDAVKSAVKGHDKQ